MPKPASRTVRVFISSTFRDMQAERDHLMRVVFPELEQRCMARGLPFVPVDLRWGVTQEEAESGEALRICLEEIEECRPFFLCLLGERYGWTPLPPEVTGEQAGQLGGNEAQLFAGAYYENEGYEEFLLRTERQRQETWGDAREDNEQALLDALVRAGVPSAGRSITAQEIYHGVLGAPEQMGHSLFYFRHPALTKALAEDGREGFYESTDEGRHKLVVLKQGIVEAGLQPQSYDEIEQLGQLVLDQLWQRITQEFPEERPAPPDPLTEERQAQELFVQRLTRFFVGREETLAELDRLAEQGGGYIAVTGPSGCGKTALLANWLYGQEGFIEKHPEAFVLSQFIGASTRSANAREILTRICQELAPLAEWTEELPLDLNELASTFPKLLAAAAQRQPILIVLDALDQLEQADNAHSLYWLPGTLPEGVTLIASSLSEDEHRTWPPLQSRAGERILRVPLLGMPASEQMIVAYLDQFRHHLSPEQLAALTDKAEIGSPLYLQVTLNELLTFGEYERVTEYLRGLPGTIPAMYEFVLEHLEREHGQGFVGRVMSCLVCGRYGMTEQELLALAGGEDAVTPLKWARLYRILSPHLLKRGEVLGFYHRQLREAVERRYQQDDEMKRHTHADIAEYFEAQPLTNRRKLEEQPFQQTLGQLGERLLATLTDYAFLDAKVRDVGTQYLVRDYERVRATETLLPQRSVESLRHIRAALVLSSHVLARDPDELASQLYGRLVGPDAIVQRLLQGVWQQRERPWLLPETGSLTHAGGPLLRTLTGHIGGVNTVAVTPDGRHAISGAWDSALKVWDLESGAELRTLTGHDSSVNAVAVTADGRRAISADGAFGNPGELKVWDLEHGAELRTLTGHRGPVTAVAVTPDGRRAISGSWDFTLKVWDLEQGVELRALTGHRSHVTAVAITPDGCRAISASRDHTLKVWDLVTGSELSTLSGHGGDVYGVAVTTDGCFAVSGGGKHDEPGELKFWDLEQGVELRTLSGHGAFVTAVAVTPDGRRAVSASDDHTLRVWDLEQGAELRTLTWHSQWIRALAVTPDGLRVISASDDQTLQVWDISAEAEVSALAGHGAFVTPVAVTPDGRRAISASEDRTLRVWDLDTGAELSTLAGHSSGVNAVAVTPDGRRAVSGSGNDDWTRPGELKLWDLDQGAELCTFRGHSSAVTAVAVTPDGRRAVSAGGRWGEPGELTVWDLATRAEMRNLCGHGTDREADVVAVSPDGRRIVSGSRDCAVRVWDTDSGAEVACLRGHEKDVESVTVSPDGCRVVSKSMDHTVRVWDLESGGELHTLSGHVERVSAVVITPDGRQAISASNDQTLKVWDLSTGAELCTLAGHSGGVNDVAVTPDGRRVVSASDDQTLRAWDLVRRKALCMFTAESGLVLCEVAPDGRTIVAGDDAGRVHILYLVNVAPGPPICTAWLDRNDGAPAFGCLHCRVWSEVPSPALDTELACPHCGKAVKLNPFVIEADWRPIAAAWRGET